MGCCTNNPLISKPLEDKMWSFLYIYICVCVWLHPRGLLKTRGNHEGHKGSDGAAQRDHLPRKATSVASMSPKQQCPSTAPSAAVQQQKAINVRRPGGTWRIPHVAPWLWHRRVQWCSQSGSGARGDGRPSRPHGPSSRHEPWRPVRPTKWTKLGQKNKWQCRWRRLTSSSEGSTFCKTFITESRLPCMVKILDQAPGRKDATKQNTRNVSVNIKRPVKGFRSA